MAPPRADIVLAFDVGSRKTGIAVGNRISDSARPLAIVRGDAKQQLAAAGDYIREWQPGLAVVGLPVHMDGSAHRMTARARRFASALEKAYALPVALADERLSSQQARRHLGRAAGGDIDDSAAAIILQDWLDGR